MVQSAVNTRKTPLRRDTYWAKATITTPLSWEKWTQQRKLVPLARKGINSKFVEVDQIQELCPPSIPYTRSRLKTQSTYGKRTQSSKSKV